MNCELHPTFKYSQRNIVLLLLFLAVQTTQNFSIQKAMELGFDQIHLKQNHEGQQSSNQLVYKGNTPTSQHQE
jgi:hypothetical protein